MRAGKPDGESDLERGFLAALRAFGGIPEPELQALIIPGRRFRFDAIWRRQRVAVEVQGAIWSQGAHGRGSGIRRDYEKLNLAAAEGWRVLQCSADMLRDDPWTFMATLKRALEGE